MKYILLIISLFLSSILGGGGTPDSGCNKNIPSAILEVAGQDRTERNPNYNIPAILPVQSAGFSEDNTGVSPSVRSSNSSRRTQVSQKSLSRIIKAGKVIDKHNFYTFHIGLNKFQCGITSSDRYIYTLCHLLI